MTLPTVINPDSVSDLSKARMSRSRFESMFFADWMRVLMMHFEVDAGALQRHVPYELDLNEGRAFVTLVAFTMENMRPGHWREAGRVVA